MFDSLVDAGLLRPAPPAADRTQLWDPGAHRAPLAQCDSFLPYEQSGWTILVGYQHLRDNVGQIYDRRRILNVHFNSADQREAVLASRGLVVCGRSVRRMTDEDRDARHAKIDPRYRPRSLRTK